MDSNKYKLQKYINKKNNENDINKKNIYDNKIFFYEHLINKSKYSNNYNHIGGNNNTSLYERLGGIYAIALVINHFSDALINNDIVGKKSKNNFLKDWNTNKLDRLPGLKWMRTLWVCDITGGPYKYIGTKKGKCPLSLEKAHEELNISSSEFNEVANELKKSLEYFKVPEEEKKEVLFAFMQHKKEISNEFYNEKFDIQC